MGQQLSQQGGLNALYWRQQTGTQHFEQHFEPQRGKQGHQAEAGAVANPSEARLRRPRANSFFMAVLTLSEVWASQRGTPSWCMARARDSMPKHTRGIAAAPPRRSVSTAFSWRRDGTPRTGR
jgi:hypothetical protein